MALSRYGGVTGTKNISEDFENINIAFNNVATENDGIKSDINQNNQDLEDHKNSTTAHAAQNITYSGSAAGTNVKEAVEGVNERINQIIQGGGPDKDAELVDIRTPDPSYTPSREITVAGDIVRDMQAQFGTQLADYAKKNYIRCTTMNYTVIPGDGTATKIIYDYQDAITDAGLYELAGGNLKVMEEGLYSIFANTAFESNGSGLRTAKIVVSYDNGLTFQRIAAVEQISPSAEYSTIINVSAPVFPLPSGAVIAIFCEQTSSFNLSVADTIGLQVAKVRG
ncbi:hypothetical protein [Paenibacillus bouchesdurhonensis]|uniref:hypothetical protein n=1 Tax=Paenibacillus bouchesdurhonensis TaxID=1870990 RepID=UPI000DA6063F|nr:hypothetical protein [Paenibacillus bouchesdurhonensis]